MGSSESIENVSNTTAETSNCIKVTSNNVITDSKIPSYLEPETSTQPLTVSQIAAIDKTNNQVQGAALTFTDCSIQSQKQNSVNQPQRRLITPMPETSLKVEQPVHFVQPTISQKAGIQQSGNIHSQENAEYIESTQEKTNDSTKLQHQLEPKKVNFTNQYQGNKLYVENLEAIIDDEYLHKEFSPYGIITSAKVMTDIYGRSKGFGFVCFSTNKEATKAIAEMNGQIVVSKPLYVALSQRKEDCNLAYLASQDMLLDQTSKTPTDTGYITSKLSGIQKDYTPYYTTQIRPTEPWRTPPKQPSLQTGPVPPFISPGFLIHPTTPPISSSAQLGQMFNPTNTRYFVPTMPQAQQGYFPPQMAQIRPTTPRWTPPIRPSAQPAPAERALDTMNFDNIKGRPIHIMWSQRDPSLRKSGLGNVFIKNLDKSIDSKALYDTFSAFGNILSCKVVATDEESGSKGYGFVHFETEEAANNAILKVNGMLLNGRNVYVGKNFGDDLDDEKLLALFEKYGKIPSAKAKTDENVAMMKNRGRGISAVKERKLVCNSGKTTAVNRMPANAEMKNELPSKSVWPPQENLSSTLNDEKQPISSWTSSRDPSLSVNKYVIIVRNLRKSINRKALYQIFSPFGNIISCKIITTDDESDGFVHFDTEEAVQNAILRMNGKLINERKIYVSKYNLHESIEKKIDEEDRPFRNVYIRNFEDHLDDEQLVDLFSSYGKITSAAVMKDKYGNSKGFGFVAFQYSEDAAKAVEVLNGTELNNRILYVRKARRESELSNSKKKQLWNYKC